MKCNTCILTSILTLVVSVHSFAAELSASVEVAPKAEESHLQILPTAAWSEAAGCWLVVWREGYLNEGLTDIWCARISADGKALDPTGVRLSSGLGIKSHPSVASDGKDFLVVWEDFRNGKDWDIYAKLVSSDGKPVKSTFIVGGGAHNQCRPSVGFDSGNYFAVWMGYTTSYGIYGTRISPAGKLLDSTPLALAPPVSADQHVITPALSSNGNILLATMAAEAKRKNRSYVAVSPINMTDLKLDLPPEPPGARVRKRISSLHGGTSRSPVIATGETEAIVAINAVSGSVSMVHVFRAELSGKITSETNIKNIFCDHQALAFDGEKYLLVVDGSEERANDKTAKPIAQIRGWHVTPDGKPGKLFIVSEDRTKQSLAPAAAGGPAGSVLVVYSIINGNDNTKLIARIVK